MVRINCVKRAARLVASTCAETPKGAASLEITPSEAAPCGVCTRAHASTRSALLTQFILTILQTLGAGIRSRGAVCAENGGLKVSFSVQNYLDVRFMGARVADFGGGAIHMDFC
jgi:hypothetical protein